MPAPEDRNIPITEAPKPESEAHSSDIPDCRPDSSVGPPAIADSQREESPMEIMQRFIEQDRSLSKEVDPLQNLKPAAEDTEKPSTELIEKDRLNEILEHARREDIPYKLLGYLWEILGQ